MFHLHQVYASLYLDRGRITVPWRSQELYFAKWLINMALFSEQCAFISVNSGNMKQRNSLTSNNKQNGRRPADMLDIYKLIYLI